MGPVEFIDLILILAPGKFSRPFFETPAMIRQAVRYLPCSRFPHDVFNPSAEEMALFSERLPLGPAGLWRLKE